ncbi:hypothetical protein K8638_12760 [Myxococcus sp. RHST-1-4]|nr:hypothetical protein [Myxococcus sp. RHSTA-1-4]
MGSPVWVQGPWPEIEPSEDRDQVIDQLCPALMHMPAATAGTHGQEYCGVIYSFQGRYYASWPAPLRLDPTSAGKDCIVPNDVRDNRGRVSVVGDYHTHPWRRSPMSEKDRWKARQRYSFRVQMDAACTVQMLIPHVHEDRPGEIYERRERRWVLIGHIYDKDSGTISPIKEAP